MIYKLYILYQGSVQLCDHPQKYFKLETILASAFYWVMPPVYRLVWKDTASFSRWEKSKGSKDDATGSRPGMVVGRVDQKISYIHFFG